MLRILADEDVQVSFRDISFTFGKLNRVDVGLRAILVVPEIGLLLNSVDAGRVLDSEAVLLIGVFILPVSSRPSLNEKQREKES